MPGFASPASMTCPVSCRTKLDADDDKTGQPRTNRTVLLLVGLGWLLDCHPITPGK